MQSILEHNILQATSVFQSLNELQEPTSTASYLVVETLRAGNKLLVCGNGGSAADAAHMTTEFVCRFDGDRRPYPAMCLSSHGGDLTAIGNDYAFVDIFARQVEAFAQPGDLLIVFSTSGNSENVVRALQAASKNHIESIAFLGRDGGRCAGLATIELIVRSDNTARIQEAQKLLLHTICEMAEESLQVPVLQNELLGIR